MRIYRLTKAKYQASAFSGIGALQSAGRWHQAGYPVVYASDTPAGALLEIIVHTEAAVLLGHRYVLFRVEFDRARHLLTLEPDLWPPGWRAPLWPRSTQRIGTRWLTGQDSAVLEVPSALVPRQRNYLLNPQHPLFEELQITDPDPFEIDPRLA